MNSIVRKSLKGVKTGDVLRIAWFDAWRDGGYQGDGTDIDHYNKMTLLDIGFFVKVTDTYVVIAEEIGVSDDDLRHIHYIPFVNITEIKRMTVIESE